VVPFATALQRSLSEEPLLTEQRLRVRCSLHSGSIVLMQTSYGTDAFGSDVNVVAHLESCAAPGQIVVSDAAYQQLPRDQQIRFGPPEHFVLTRPPLQVTIRRLDLGEG
jgi:class 3 adenylate cyclase